MTLPFSDQGHSLHNSNSQVNDQICGEVRPEYLEANLKSNVSNSKAIRNSFYNLIETNRISHLTLLHRPTTIVFLYNMVQELQTIKLSMISNWPLNFWNIRCFCMATKWSRYKILNSKWPMATYCMTFGKLGFSLPKARMSQFNISYQHMDRSIKSI